MKAIIGFVGLFAIIIVSLILSILTFHWMFPALNGCTLYVISCGEDLNTTSYYSGQLQGRIKINGKVQ